MSTHNISRKANDTSFSSNVISYHVPGPKDNDNIRHGFVIANYFGLFRSLFSDVIQGNDALMDSPRRILSSVLTAASFMQSPRSNFFLSHSSPKYRRLIPISRPSSLNEEHHLLSSVPSPKISATFIVGGEFRRAHPHSMTFPEAICYDLIPKVSPFIRSLLGYYSVKVLVFQQS